MDDYRLNNNMESVKPLMADVKIISMDTEFTSVECREKLFKANIQT